MFGSSSTQKTSDSSANKMTSPGGFYFGTTPTQLLSPLQDDKMQLPSGNNQSEDESCESEEECSESEAHFQGNKLKDIDVKQELQKIADLKFGTPSEQKVSDLSASGTPSSGGFNFGVPSTLKISDSSTSEQTSSGGFSFGLLSSLKISDSSASDQTSSGGTSKLVEDFKNVFISGEDSDVIIKVKDTEFRAHKIILRARSPVFRAMFSHGMVEQNSGTVSIIDCEPEAFKIYLLYLYSGSVENLTTNTVFDLYKVAEKYDAGELKLTCKKFMVSRLSVDTICDVIEHSLQYNEKELLKTATQFFTTNFKEIIQSVKWQSFLIKNPVAANELFIEVSDCYVLRRNKKSSARSRTLLDT